MLAPMYARYMSSMIGSTISKSAFIQMDGEDQQRMFLVALYLSRDKQARKRVLEMLSEYGHWVVDNWHRYYLAVVETNEAGANSADLDVNKFLARLKPGT